MQRMPATVGNHPHSRATFELTERRKATFLDHLAEIGVITDAAKAAGITPSSVYGWRQRDRTFAKAFNEALYSYADRLEREAFRRAVEGVDDPVIHQGRQSWETVPVLDDAGRPVLDEEGRPVMRYTGRPLAVRKYSDSLLSKLLEARNPRFAAKQRLELTGADGGAIQVETDTTEAARRIAFALAQGRLAARASADGAEVVDGELVADGGPRPPVCEGGTPLRAGPVAQEGHFTDQHGAEDMI